MRIVPIASRLALTAGITAGIVVPLSHAASTNAAASAYIRVLHAVPDAPAVEVFVDGAKAVKSLAYPKETGYVALPAGAHHIQVFPAGAAYTKTGGVIDAAGVTVKGGTYYTIAAIGTLKTIKPLVLVNDVKAPVGKTAVRFVHLAPDAPAVAIEAKGAGLIFPNVSFGGVAIKPYVQVPGGSYTLLVHPAGAKAVVLSTTVPFKANHSYTVYAIGLLKGTGVQKLGAIVADDTPMAM